MTLHLMTTQKVQIRNLATNPGILPFKLGTSRIQIASHTFLHYIQIDSIKNQTLSLIKTYKNFEQVINNATPFQKKSLLNSYKHLEYEVNTLHQKLFSIFPETRRKRGLFNPMGSLIKYFTGNMDAQDAQEIHDSISELEATENKIIKKVNRQISLTSTLMSNINQTVTKVISNQGLIETKIEQLRTAMNEEAFNYAHYLEIQEVLNQIKLNLDSSLNFLSELENAIGFANLQTLHHSIVSPSELKSIIKILEHSHSDSQVLYSLKDYLKYYEIVKTNVIISNNKIIFSLDFPLVHPDTFNHYHLFAIPNQNKTIIIPPSAYLSISNSEYQYHDEECKNLWPNFLCNQNHLLPLQENPDCITSLLSVENQLQNCQQVPVQVTQQVIEQINEAHYIGIFPERQKLQTTCVENDVALLQGTYLFTVPPNCAIQSASFTYKNYKGVIVGHPITLEDINEINLPVLSVEKLHLERIPLDKLHELQLQESTEEPLREIKLQSRHFQWLLWTTIFLVTTIATYVVFRKRLSMCSTLQKQPSPSSSKVNETQVVPPSSSF